MILFQLWAFVVGLLLVGLAWRTRRFTKNLMLLQDLPGSLKLTPAQKKYVGNTLWPKISLVIPACNEGLTIQSAMESLLKVDYPNLEIIVVNDRSNDKTRQIVDQISLMDDRIVPVHVNYLPAGWLGKVNALNRGMNMTTAEWLLLSDADVHFSPDSIKNAITYCLKDQIDFLTAIPDVKTRGALLQVVIAQLFHQASLFFNPQKINDPSHKACYGQGAFMLMRKSVYLKSEGMDWLKMEVVDDTGLALLMRRAGARMAAVSGLNQIQLEWYPSFSAFLNGIEKNAFAFSQYSLVILLSFSISVLMVFLGFTIAPVLGGSVAIALFSFLCLTLYLYTIHLQMRKILHLRSWTVLAFPLAFVLLPVLFLRASFRTLWRGGVNWRGTFYDLAALRANQRMKLANLVFTRPKMDVDLPLPTTHSTPEKSVDGAA